MFIWYLISNYRESNTQVASDVNKVCAERQQKAPYALIVGGHKDQQQAFLIIDGRVVTEVPVNDVPIYLMATYYILNICYPPGCQNLYCFLEVVLLKLEEPHITITTSVKHLLARLRLY